MTRRGLLVRLLAGGAVGALAGCTGSKKHLQEPKEGLDMSAGDAGPPEPPQGEAPAAGEGQPPATGEAAGEVH